MSEPTREERLEAAARFVTGDKGWAEDVLDAAGVWALLSERDQLREAAQAVLEAYPADRWPRSFNPTLARLRAVLGEPVPEESNDG